MKKIFFALVLSFLFVSHSFAYDASQNSKNSIKKEYYYDDTLGLKLIYDASLSFINQYQSINLFNGDHTYFVTTYWEGEANDVYKIAKDVRKSRISPKDDTKNYWYSTVSKLSKVTLGGVDAYYHIQRFPNAGFSTYNYHLYHNGQILEITVDSRMRGFKNTIKTLTFY